MNKFKILNTILLTSILTLGTSAIIFAATLTTNTYIVKSGNCLSVIAQDHGESLNNLRKTNNKWNDSIFQGQVLNVPITSDLTKDQVAQNNVPSYKNYTVKSGNCLSVIAQDHGESLVSLRKANNKWNDFILPGQVLNVSITAISTVNQISSGSINYTPSDVTLLARLITAEAGGTSYNDQVSVGAVVLNRVKSSLFPNSINAVINQNSQFTPVTNGSINKTAQASAIKAAYSALSGNDPTNKALYFHNDNNNNLIFEH